MLTIADLPADDRSITDLTVPEFARERGIAKVTAYRHIREGRIRAYLFKGSLILVPRSELDRARAEG